MKLPPQSHAHEGWRQSLARIAVLLVSTSCSSSSLGLRPLASSADSGTRPDSQAGSHATPEAGPVSNGGAVDASAGAAPDLGGAARDAGTATDAATDRHDASSACAPLPCPSGAPWNASTCSCGARDAGGPNECTKDSDCTLIPLGCCVCPPITRPAAVRSAPLAQQAHADPMLCPAVACAPCPVLELDPLAPILKPACVANQCQVVDLRKLELSECASDSDCLAIGHLCCPPNSEDPAQYVGVRSGAETGILACFPVPPCMPPPMHADPIAYCAADDHCAIRRLEHREGAVSSTCFSPTQNLERAYGSGAQGCDCKPGNTPLCRRDSAGRDVSFVCGDDGRWAAVEDGACTPGP